MKDPERLLRGDATPLERLLLEASSRERPAPELLAQTRSALGLPPASPSFGLRDALSSWGPKVLVALAGAALVGTLVHGTKPAATPAASVPAAKAPAPPPTTDETKAKAAPRDPAATEAPTLSVESLPLAPPERTAPSPAPSSTRNASAADSLREEIAQLDKVRSAMRQGAPVRALSELDTYRARFPRGVLRQESVVLRIEALQKSGNTARAKALAQSYLGRHPNSPHAERIAHIIGSSTAGTR